jgi:hypothetical protein
MSIWLLAPVTAVLAIALAGYWYRFVARQDAGSAGPSLNTLITVMSLGATLLAGWMARYNLVRLLWG